MEPPRQLSEECQASNPRDALRAARRIVVKAGTRTLTREDGLPALSRLFGLVEQIADLHRGGREVLLVSSGAVGLGRQRLGLSAPLSLADRQACAAVGQSRLMALYEQGFARYGVECAQLLLTRGDFRSRQHYLNLRATLASLLRRRVVPIINENDAVATDELVCERPGAGATKVPDDSSGTPPAALSGTFGDNDELSALVAAKLDADLLVMLTDVEGVWDVTAGASPHTTGTPAILERIDESDLARVAASARPHDSRVSRGGMRSKLAAAGLAARAGCHAVIASGMAGDVLERLLDAAPCGTWIPASTALAARRRWIAFASAPRGCLHLDEGAVRAVAERGASLLAAGIVRASGDFDRGDVVELRDARDTLLGRGLVHCDLATTLKWMQGEVPAGVRNHDALVHRDNLVLFEHGTAPVSTA